MTCEEIPWIEYLEARLAAQDRAAVGAHLAGCTACSREAVRWRELLAAAAASPAGLRLGCPSPAELAALGTTDARPEVAEHLATCSPCAEEARAVAGAELGIDVEAAALPPALRHVATPASGTLARVAGEVLAVVRSRLGETHPAFARWRLAVAELMLPGPVAEGAYAAPAEPDVLPASDPLEVRVQSGSLDVSVSSRRASVRVSVRRDGAPVSGVHVDLEDALGGVKSSTTDRRGEAVIQDDLPGRRKVGVREV